MSCQGRLRSPERSVPVRAVPQSEAFDRFTKGSQGYSASQKSGFPKLLSRQAERIWLSLLFHTDWQMMEQHKIWGVFLTFLVWAAILWGVFQLAALVMGKERVPQGVDCPVAVHCDHQPSDSSGSQPACKLSLELWADLKVNHWL